MTRATRADIPRLLRELADAFEARPREIPPADSYLSTVHAAELADVAPGTIRRWIREGRLVGHRAGRKVCVRRSELEQLLRSDRGAGNMTPEQLAARDFG